MSDDRTRMQHPSGHPIRRARQGVRSIVRILEDGPLTPRLRQRELASAIGFHAHLVREDDED